ncbi:MAG: tetratricopeptide repeat protein [Planctomycetaceae bacterium]|nr:tetratricopeptide repeat protein [Planctomycetaceae bacterium]
MQTTFITWRRRAIGVACAAALAGCSSSKSALTQSSSSPMPDRQTTMVPGTPDRAEGTELRNPGRIHVAYARWQEQQKQLPQARESYQKALSHDPKSVDALLGLSRLDQLAGRTTEAEQRLARAEELQPKSSLISAAWAEHHAAQHRWPEAVARYREAIERQPNEALYRHQLAVVMTKAGQIDEAIAAFTPLVGAAEAHYNVGFLLHQQGQTMAAEEQFREAITLKPEFTTAIKMLARTRRDRGLDAPVMTAASSVPQLQSPVAAPASSDTDVQPVAWKPRDALAESTPVSSVPQPPPGLTPQQLEQWSNQRAAGR